MGTWTLLTGAVTDYRLHDTRRAILAAVRDRSPLTPKQIADATGIEYETAKKTAQRMAKDGQLHADSAGRYAPVSLSLVSPVSLISEGGDSRDSRDRDSGEEELPLDPEEPE